MKTTNFLSIRLFVLILLMSFDMSAQGRRGGHMRMGRPVFSNFDFNGDGFITKEEFNKARAERMRQQAQKGGKMKNVQNRKSFENFDANKDGRISKEEFKRYQQMNQNKYQNKNKNKNKQRKKTSK